MSKILRSSLRKISLFVITAAITLALTLTIPAYSQPSPSPTIPEPTLSPSGEPIPGVGWEVTTTSGKSEINLARHLTKIGAVQYVAWWCPHCYEQNQLFGLQAYKELKSIECDPKGKNPRPDLCKAAGVQGYPTWKIKGKLYAGVQRLDTLAKISKYKGLRKFKNFTNAFKS